MSTIAKAMAPVNANASARAAALPALGDYLGPAHVVSTSRGAVQARLPGGEVVSARMAMALPYEAAPEDVLLVIGKGEDYYVIGVLDGAGRTALRFQGDVELHATGGALRLSGDQGVQIEGPEVEVRSEKLRMMAGAVVQRFTSVLQRVSALLSVHAGQSQTVVDEASVTRAKSAAILTEETMTINGKQIHLG